jgi:hypothetical protein
MYIKHTAIHWLGVRGIKTGLNICFEFLATLEKNTFFRTYIFYLKSEQKFKSEKLKSLSKENTYFRSGTNKKKS